MNLKFPSATDLQFVTKNYLNLQEAVKRKIMGIKEANIYLDNPHNTYYAGQTVNGRIEYVFDSVKKVRGIQVEFLGTARTEWFENEQDRNRSNDPVSETKNETTDLARTGQEEYFKISYYLVGSNGGNNEIEIPPGKQIYNFTFTLPPVLPSSFEGEFGYVRYTIKVTLDRPWKFNQETKMAFTVLNTLDLNLNPSYKEPIHMQMEKTFCCFCCASAPLSVDVRAPVTGYCPGQVIPVQIDVDNKSNVQVHLVKIFLRKLVTYRSQTPVTATKKTKDVVLTKQEGPVSAGASKSWTINMEVPTIPPSNLVNCSIIDLDYDLQVVVVVSGMHINLKDKKYVTIGTVPLVGVATAPSAPAVTDAGQPAVLPVTPGYPPEPQQGGESSPGWVNPGAQPPPYQSLYPSLAEPVYKESLYSARSIQDRGDSNFTRIAGPANFAPYYPTYSAVQPPPLPQI